MYRQINGFSRYEINECGVVRTIGKKREIKQQTKKKGYKFLRLVNDEGVRKSLSVHRLVGIVYIPNPDKLPQVNHLDGDKANNHVSNLEWCTNQENMDHAHAIGLREGIHPTGRDHHKTDQKKYHWINYETLQEEECLSVELCEKYGLDATRIRRVARGDSMFQTKWMLKKEYDRGEWKKYLKNVKKNWYNKLTGEREYCTAAELAKKHNLPQPNAGKLLGRKSYKGWLLDDNRESTR